MGILGEHFLFYKELFSCILGEEDDRCLNSDEVLSLEG